ncbi:MAG: 50S ribosomal protein L3 [candidate division WOR-3 bacterium]
MLIGIKLGMTRVPSQDGVMIPVTAIRVGPCFVLDLKTPDRDGYSAIKVGFGDKKPSRISRPLLNQLRNALGERETYPAEVIKEFRVADTGSFQVGQEINLKDLVPLAEETEGLSWINDFWVDVTGMTKGRGTAGWVKRWGFAGGPKAHGSKFGRRPGSIGQHSEPSKVFKGLKMAGRYGNEKLTVVGLKAVGAMPEKGVLLVRGAVPGPTGGYLIIVPSKRRQSRG